MFRITKGALALVLCGGTLGAAELRTIPSNIHHYEVVAATATSQLAADASTGKQELSFNALGRGFDLELEPNPLFAKGARNLWIGDKGERSEVPAAAFYKGQVKGDRQSWLRLTMKNGELDGIIRTRNEVYFVEPASRYPSAADSKGSIIYRLSDTESDWTTQSCPLDMPAPEPIPHVGSDSGAQDQIKAFLPASVATTYKQCEIAIVADYEYYLEHGSSSATDMQSIINQVDGIYRSELGTTFSIVTTVVYSTSSDPFTSTTNYDALLDELSAYRNNPAYPVYGSDLTHLFTNRDLDSTVIGIAWIDALCSSYYGAGLSQDYTSTNRNLVLLTAHEIGHNFGAYHDNQTGSPCVSTAFGYIMNPWVSSSLAYQFSTCSKSYVNPAIAAASCLSTVTESSNQAPVANAGADQSVSASDGVWLNGGGSYDPDGTAITYFWEQISGPSVYVWDTTTSAPSFWAPGYASVLGFRLTVSDGSLSSTDTVNVTVGSSGGVVPTITDMTSRRARPNTAANIIGSGFSYSASDLDVRFSDVRARVQSASPTNIRVKIPRVSRHSWATVTVTVSGVVSNTYWFWVN